MPWVLPIELVQISAPSSCWAFDVLTSVAQWVPTAVAALTSFVFPQAGEKHYHPSCALCVRCGQMFSEGEEMYLQGKHLDMPIAYCAQGVVVKLVLVLLRAGTVTHIDYDPDSAVWLLRVSVNLREGDQVAKEQAVRSHHCPSGLIPTRGLKDFQSCPT